jgi:hypothetical protein
MRRFCDFVPQLNSVVACAMGVITASPVVISYSIIRLIITRLSSPSQEPHIHALLGFSGHIPLTYTDTKI